MSEETGQVLPPKYQVKDYRGAEDWVGEFIDDCCAEVGRDDLDVKTVVERIAAANGIPDYKINKHKDKSPGLFRMTIGNMLRAIARKRHGLKDMDEDFVPVHADTLDAWIASGKAKAEPTETPEGHRIVKTVQV